MQHKSQNVDAKDKTGSTAHIIGSMRADGLCAAHVCVGIKATQAHQYIDKRSIRLDTFLNCCLYCRPLAEYSSLSTVHYGQFAIHDFVKYVEILEEND